MVSMLGRSALLASSWAVTLRKAASFVSGIVHWRMGYMKETLIYFAGPGLFPRYVQHFGVKISHLNRNLQHLGPKIGNSDSVQLSLNLVCRVFAFAAY